MTSSFGARSASAALEARGVRKSYGGRPALAGADLAALPGEIHVLLGENGAGKTTLMNVLYGLVRPDAGTLLRSGKPLRLSGPAAAVAAGIGMVHQHFLLVPAFTVAENLILGEANPDGSPALRLREAEARIREAAKRFGLDVDPAARVEDLSVGDRQRAEILKALWRGAEVLILDEPTAVLAPHEADALLAVLRRLRAEGKAVILITHKLAEARAAADRITVLRAGRVAGSLPGGVADAAALTEMMVGRAAPPPSLEPIAPGAPVLEVEGLRFADERGAREFAADALAVRAGEIVGIAGVDGNGQRELAETLLGLRPPRAGAMRLGGADLAALSVSARRARGLAVVAPDRREEGLVLGFDLADNAVLGRQRAPESGRGPLLSRARALALARELIARHDVRCSGPRAQAASLSGGNQQKFVVGRELAGDPALLVAVNPTRGVDVGAAAAIHGLLAERRRRGLATLLVSTELDEVLALSDRVAVLHAGQLGAALPRAEATRERVGARMVGGEAA